MYLIHRGQFNSNLDTATGLFGGKESNLIKPEYMGAAEFEFGAIPRAFRRIMGQYDKYSLHVTDLVTIGGVPFCLYCRDDRYDAILAAIKVYLEKDYRLKTWSNMHYHFKPIPTDNRTLENNKWHLKTNFWWCIDVASISDDYHITGDWIAFTGATDRQKAFTRVMDSDYHDWWMKKPERERQAEFEIAFR